MFIKLEVPARKINIYFKERTYDIKWSFLLNENVKKIKFIAFFV